MPFAKWVIDEVYERANRIWDEAWRNPEHPPTVHYQPDTELFREGDHGIDVSNCFELTYDPEKSTWTVVALAYRRWTHLATRAGWVSEQTTIDGDPKVVAYTKGDKLVMTIPPIGVVNAR